MLGMDPAVTKGFKALYGVSIGLPSGVMGSVDGDLTSEPINVRNTGTKFGTLAPWCPSLPEPPMAPTLSRWADPGETSTDQCFIGLSFLTGDMSPQLPNALIKEISLNHMSHGFDLVAATIISLSFCQEAIRYTHRTIEKNPGSYEGPCYCLRCNPKNRPDE